MVENWHLFSFQGFGSGFSTTPLAKFAKIPAIGFALSLVSGWIVASWSGVNLVTSKSAIHSKLGSLSCWIGLNLGEQVVPNPWGREDLRRLDLRRDRRFEQLLDFFDLLGDELDPLRFLDFFLCLIFASRSGLGTF